LFGATDITAAETRLKEIPGQGYLRLEYGAPTVILPKRPQPLGLTPGRC